MTRYAVLIIIGLVLIAAGLLVLAQCNEPPPVDVTPTIVTSTPTATATSTPMPSISPSATFYAPTAAVTPVATRTPVLTATATISAMETVAPSPTATVAVTAELLGHHRVGRGETMYGIGLEWYRGRYLAWGADVWRPICDANPQIVDCRLIYPGDVLGVPRLP